MNKKIGFFILGILMGIPTLDAAWRLNDYQYERALRDRHQRYVDMKNRQRTENVIILWDIHDVIVKRNKWKTTKAIFGYQKKYALTSHMSWPLIKGMMHKIETSESLMEMADQHGNPELAQLVCEVSNIVDPIEGTVDIIKELKALGYTNHVGSNIGAKVFADLCEKMPHIFKDNFDLSASQVACYKEGQILKKPDPKFFKEYLRKNDINLKKKTVIFIDDKLENVRAAQKVGMIGIHFKNPQQLSICLQTLCGIVGLKVKRDLNWYRDDVFFPRDIFFTR